MNTFQGLIKNKTGERYFHLHLIKIFIFTHRNEKDNRKYDRVVEKPGKT